MIPLGELPRDRVLVCWVKLVLAKRAAHDVYHNIWLMGRARIGKHEGDVRPHPACQAPSSFGMVVQGRPRHGSQACCRQEVGAVEPVDDEVRCCGSGYVENHRKY